MKELDKGFHPNKEIKMPKESYGLCEALLWSKRCRNSFAQQLANGVCQECWDKGLGGQRIYYKKRSNKTKETERT